MPNKKCKFLSQSSVFKNIHVKLKKKTRKLSSKALFLSFRVFFLFTYLIPTTVIYLWIFYILYHCSWLKHGIQREKKKKRRKISFTTEFSCFLFILHIWFRPLWFSYGFFYIFFLFDKYRKRTLNERIWSKMKKKLWTIMMQFQKFRGGGHIASNLFKIRRNDKL